MDDKLVLYDEEGNIIIEGFNNDEDSGIEVTEFWSTFDNDGKLLTTRDSYSYGFNMENHYDGKLLIGTSYHDQDGTKYEKIIYDDKNKILGMVDKNDNFIEKREYYDTGILKTIEVGDYVYHYHNEQGLLDTSIIHFDDCVMQVTYMYDNMNRLVEERNIKTYNEEDKPEDIIVEKYFYKGDSKLVYCTITDIGDYQIDTQNLIDIIEDENKFLNDIFPNSDIQLYEYKENGHLIRKISSFYTTSNTNHNTEANIIYEYDNNGNIIYERYEVKECGKI